MTASDDTKARLRKMVVGPCRHCGLPVTEADEWGFVGEKLDAYPPVTTKVHHNDCQLLAASVPKDDSF